MEICGTCFYLVMVGDPKVPINECHRYPPNTEGKYPSVKDADAGCGEWVSLETQSVTAGKPAQSGGIVSKARGIIDKARGKALG
jgi:hypothetical protein